MHVNARYFSSTTNVFLQDNELLSYLDVEVCNAAVVQVLHDVQGLSDVLCCQKLIKVWSGADVLKQPALGDSVKAHQVPTSTALMRTIQIMITYAWLIGWTLCSFYNVHKTASSLGTAPPVVLSPKEVGSKQDGSYDKSGGCCVLSTMFTRQLALLVQHPQSYCAQRRLIRGCCALSTMFTRQLALLVQHLKLYCAQRKAGFKQDGVSNGILTSHHPCKVTSGLRQDGNSKCQYGVVFSPKFPCVFLLKTFW